MVTEKIEETIKKYNLIEENDIIVVAVSGGPDSMCLLDNLIKLKEKLKIKELVVAHLNHMIRQEAKTETEYVENFCKNHNIKCYTKFVKVEDIAKNQKIGTEEAGRNARYEFFDEVKEKTNANKIAIAHNKKDNCETVLMHLMRGSGLAGLAGIKPYSNDKYIRPLINCSREEIENYCKEQKLDPKFDKTNEDSKYTRNRIRNELIPYIEEKFNPNIIETVNRLSQVIDETENYMEKQTILALNELVEIREKNQIALNLKKFNMQDKIIKSRLILLVVKELFGTSKGIEKIHIEDIIKLCGNNIGGKFLTPNKNLKVLLKDKKVYFIKL